MPSSTFFENQFARHLNFHPPQQLGLLAAVLPSGKRPSIAMAIVPDDCLQTVGATITHIMPLCNQCKLCKRLCEKKLSSALQLGQKSKKIENKNCFTSSIVRRKVLRMEKECAISFRILNKKHRRNANNVAVSENRYDDTK